MSRSSGNHANRPLLFLGMAIVAMGAVAPSAATAQQTNEPEELHEEAETPQRLTAEEARPAEEAYKALYYDPGGTAILASWTSWEGKTSAI